MTSLQQHLARKYVLYKLFTNLWFVGAVWLYFYRMFLSDREVGIVDGMAFGIGLLAEVPSGALADKFGRDRLVKLGQLLVALGFVIQLLGSSLAQFIIGQAVLMIGMSFVSGADEALFFDTLQFDKNSTEWRKLITRGSQVALLGSMLATIAGGVLHTIEPRLPWILNAVAFLAAIAVIWSLKDTRPVSERKELSEELKDYLVSIKNGFAQFMTEKLRLYVPLILIVQGLFYAAGWGLLRLVLLDRFGFSPFAGSVVIAATSLITVGALALMHKYAERLSERRVLFAISIAAATGLLLSLFDIGMWGVIVVLTLQVGEYIMLPFMSEILNYHTDEKQRATVLSVASFLRTLPYVVLAPLIGYLNTQNMLEVFFVVWSACIGIALMVYFRYKQRDAQIQIA